MPPWIRAFRASWTFLTRIPVGGFPYPPATWTWISIWFPTVGLCLGAMQAVLWAALASPTNPWLQVVAVIVAVAAGMLVTGGFHEDGLADSFDALGGGYDKASVLRILKDSRIGTFGTLAVLITVGLRIALLCALGPRAPLGFLLGQSVSRATPVALLAVLPYARRDDAASRSRDVARSGGVQAILAAASAGLFLAVLSPSLATGTAIVLGAAGVTAIWGAYVYRRVGGLTGDFLGAAQQLAELCILGALVVFDG